MPESKIENQIRFINYKWTLDFDEKGEIKWTKLNSRIDDVEPF